MRNYSFTLIILSFLLWQCSKPAPTSFDEKALQTTLINEAREELTFSEVLKSLEGKIILIDIWASWCSDCIESIPEMKNLKSTYGKEVVFLYLSMDKSIEEWIAATDKYKIEGKHYYLGSVWKSAFNQSIDLKWIPRFIIVGKDGKIKLYNAERADDANIKKTLNDEIAHKSVTKH